MSTSISLIHKCNGANYGIGWLNNNYGLLPWAEDNFSFYAGLPRVETDAEDLLDRGLDNNDDKQAFWQLVRKYEKNLREKETFFFFGISDYIRCIEPYRAILPMEYTPYMRVKGVQFAFNMAAIPVNHFRDSPFHLVPPGTLDIGVYYKKWLKDLVNIAYKITKNEYDVFVAR